jgi:hypothetical protein
MDSNHDYHKQRRICNLKSLQWSNMPDWTRRTPTRTQPVHRLALMGFGRFRFRAPGLIISRLRTDHERPRWCPLPRSRTLMSLTILKDAGSGWTAVTRIAWSTHGGSGSGLRPCTSVNDDRLRRSLGSRQLQTLRPEGRLTAALANAECRHYFSAPPSVWFERRGLIPSFCTFGYQRWYVATQAGRSPYCAPIIQSVDSTRPERTHAPLRQVCVMRLPMAASSNGLLRRANNFPTKYSTNNRMS